MSVEMTAVAFNGEHTAAHALTALRGARDDAWLAEVAVLEHHTGERFTIHAASEDYGDLPHKGAGAVIGGLTGLFVGALAGPFGLAWAAIGAITGRAIGKHHDTGPLDPVVAKVREALPEYASALLLVGEQATADAFIAAAEAQPGFWLTLREPLTEEQLEQLREAAPA